MAGMFVAALAVPEAFGSDGVVFGVAFLVVAVIHVTSYSVSARTEPAGYVEKMAAVTAAVPGAPAVSVT
jgi:low temperature requirement protein LtrA